VFRDDKLLLVRERIDGSWTLPGGWADVGNEPAAAAERETWEEAGFKVKATKVIGVYDANRIEPMSLFHAFKIVFLCDLLGGTAQPSAETTEVDFFGLDEVDDLDFSQRTRPRHILDAFAAWRNPHRPTVFD
jgi:8-oxo-dGTP pyrophosphatase MutT (NUDIX family)